MKTFQKAILFALGLILLAINAQAARWMTPDPMDIPAHMERDPHPFLDLNAYTFVGNDPVNKIDPWGLWEQYLNGTGSLTPEQEYEQDQGLLQLPGDFVNFVDWASDEGGLTGLMGISPSDAMTALGPHWPEFVPPENGLLESSGWERPAPKPTECPKPVLTGTEAARAALGKGPNAVPGAPLTPGMQTALQQNLQAAQSSLNLAKQGLNVAGNQIAAEQAAIQAATAQARINEINATLQSGIQAPKN